MMRKKRTLFVRIEPLEYQGEKVPQTEWSDIEIPQGEPGGDGALLVKLVERYAEAHPEVTEIRADDVRVLETWVREGV